MSKNPAKTGQTRRETRADVASLRAKAATLYAQGLDAKAVAAQLGITPRRARQLKADVSDELRRASEKTIHGIVDAADRARSEIAEHAMGFVGVLVNAAHGRLRMGMTDAELEALDGGEVPIERDPQSVNARVRAASTALQFVLAQKVEANVAPLSLETAAQVAAIVRAQQAQEDDGQP